MEEPQRPSPRRHGWGLIKEIWRLWFANNPFQHAAALAYFTVFSLAPLLIILLAVAGAVFGEEAVRGEIFARLVGQIGPQAAAAIEEAVRKSRIEVAGVWPTLLASLALLFGGTTMFAQMQNSLNQYWGVTSRPGRNDIVVFLTTRAVSLMLVFALSVVLLLSVAMGMAVVALLRFANAWVAIPITVVTAIHLTASLCLTTLLTAMIFKILPDVTLQWSDVWRGAFVTASLFVAGQWLLSMYLTRVSVASTYGAAGSVVILLVWVYYSSLILLLGAAVTRAMVHGRGRRLMPKGRAISTLPG
jgi:membrane protein